MSQIADILLSYLPPVAARDRDLLIRRLTEVERNAFAVGANMGVRGEATTLRSGNVTIEYTEGVTLRNPTTSKRTVYLDADGDAFFGKDIDDPADMSLAIFSNAQEYNGESLGEGDLLIGDNSSGAANMLWDNSAGQLKFRGGTTTQVYIDTDGTLTAGGGAVQLDSTGVIATAGAIGGWTITSSQIRKTGIILDSTNDRILVGQGAPQIEIDGGNRRIRSSNYVAGALGFDINALTGDFEVNNLRARGEIITSVFKVNEVTATAGTFGVFPSASTLYADFTSPSAINGSGNLYARNSDGGLPLFATGDALYIKAVIGGVTKQAWVQVNSVSNQTTYSDYTITLKSGDTNTTFRKGNAVVDYGSNGEGFIILSADGTVGASANMTIGNHAGSPWSATTILTRLGNLNGSYGAVADYYGIGIGNYNGGNGNYLRYNWDNNQTFEIKTGDGIIKMSASGLEFLDTSTSVSRISYYYQGKGLGYFTGDYGGTGDGVMWAVASKDSGDPWTNVRVVLSAINNTANPVTKARIDLVSTGLIDMQGNVLMDSTLDVTGNISTDGSVILNTEEKSVQFWDSTTSDLMADIISQYADSTAKLWIRTWRQTGDPWTSGSTILLRAKDDVAGTEGALNIQSTGEISTQGWASYSATVNGWSSLTVNQTYYKVIGKTLIVAFNLEGTSNATTASFTLPSGLTSTSNIFQCGFARAQDNGTYGANPGLWSLNAGTSQVNLHKTQTGGGGWTASGTKAAQGTVIVQLS